jgi:hypothetical protein
VQGAARLAGYAVTLSLPIVAISELSSPAELFRCAFYSTTLSAGACIARQTMRKTFRGGQYTPAAYEHCASKKCEQGNAVRERLAGYVPPRAGDEAHEERVATAQARLAAIEEKLAAEPKPAANEESEMAEKKCRIEDCSYPLRSDNVSGLCGWHCNGRTTPRPADWKSPGKSASAAPRAAAPAKPRPVRAVPAPPVVDDELQRIALVLREWRALSPEGRAYLSAATSREDLHTDASAQLPGRAAR